MKKTVIKTSRTVIDESIKISCKEDLKQKLIQLVDNMPPFLESSFFIRGVVTTSIIANEE